MYSALIRAINTEGLGEWRDGATKIVIPIGDAPPHDPEPFTGYTASSVEAAAKAVDPAVICPVVVGGDPTAYYYFLDLAQRTGGKVFKAADASEVVGAILTAIHEISEGNIGQPPPPPPTTIEAIRDEILWLLGVLDTADIQPGVKNALRAKLENTLPHIDKALACEDAGDDKGVKTALQPCLGMLRAFVNQVEAQYDKKISQPDAGIFIERVNEILDKIAEISST
ncbi:MAG: hypothetical protein ACUVRM_11555 [Bacillota bacterium]